MGIAQQAFAAAVAGVAGVPAAAVWPIASGEPGRSSPLALVPPRTAGPEGLELIEVATVSELVAAVTRLSAASA